MIDFATACGVIAESLSRSGLVGRGSIWRFRGQDVQWVVHIDRLPYGNRLGVDVGLDLQLDSTPRRPTDCPILLHIENLKSSSPFAVLEALDLDSGLLDDDRLRELTGAARSLGAYISERRTLKTVRDSYRGGDFASGFIHRDARVALEADDSADRAQNGSTSGPHSAESHG